MVKERNPEKDTDDHEVCPIPASLKRTLVRAQVGVDQADPDGKAEETFRWSAICREEGSLAGPFQVV